MLLSVVISVSSILRANRNALGIPLRKQSRRNPMKTEPRRRKVRILATLGPASSSFAQIRALYLAGADAFRRSEEHTSELQSLMRNSYAVFCLQKKQQQQPKQQHTNK